MEQKYKYTNLQKFYEDMKKAGFPVTEYTVRLTHDEVPAVAVGVRDQPSEQAVMRATKVRLTWDTLGKGKILYPQYRGTPIEEAAAEPKPKRFLANYDAKHEGETEYSTWDDEIEAKDIHEAIDMVIERAKERGRVLINRVEVVEAEAPV